MGEHAVGWHGIQATMCSASSYSYLTPISTLITLKESLAATYGAGVSNACVVNIGAKSTSLACVDEGLVIAESRMNLNLGGDDITEFLYVLLERIGFPYRDIDLSRAYDWNIMEDLKARLCTLTEVCKGPCDMIVLHDHCAAECCRPESLRLCRSETGETH